MAVKSLMSGGLEPTNEPYAVAKLAGLYLCRAYRQQFQAKFITAIPANVFGPGDDFSLEDSHVIAALIRKMHEAKISRQREVVIWGSGLPRRDFVFAEDMADACLFLMDHYDGAEPVNVGVGADWSIRQLGEMIAEVVGFAGNLVFPVRSRRQLTRFGLKIFFSHARRPCYGAGAHRVGSSSRCAYSKTGLR